MIGTSSALAVCALPLTFSAGIVGAAILYISARNARLAVRCAAAPLMDPPRRDVDAQVVKFGLRLGWN